MHRRKFLDVRVAGNFLARARKRGKWKGKLENLCAARGWVGLVHDTSLAPLASAPRFNHFLDQNNLILSLTLSIVFPSFHGRPMRRCVVSGRTTRRPSTSNRPQAPIGQRESDVSDKTGHLYFPYYDPFPFPHLIVTDIRFRQIFIAPVETVHPKTLESPG